MSVEREVESFINLEISNKQYKILGEIFVKMLRLIDVYILGKIKFKNRAGKMKVVKF